jgi:hypothetical protein
MPYIKQERRDLYDSLITELVGKLRDNGSNPAGDLNYIITNLLKKRYSGEECYKIYNEMIGILECCKLELYRRAISDYEDLKIKENGDV